MNEEIPHFVDATNKMISGLPVVERDMATVILYDPIADTVLSMVWNNFDWRTLVNGGVDPGEDVVTAGAREVREETGYKNIKFVGEIGKAKSSFYAANKNENRISNATGLVFELLDHEREEVAKEEEEKHLTRWVHKSEIASFVNIDWQLYLLEKALASKLLYKK